MLRACCLLTCLDNDDIAGALDLSAADQPNQVTAGFQATARSRTTARRAQAGENAIDQSACRQRLGTDNDWLNDVPA
jgi:hypothetical protein